MARVVANWIYRLLFCAGLSAGFIGALWLAQPTVKQAAWKSPVPIEAPFPGRASGPTVEQTVKAMGQNRPEDVIDRPTDGAIPRKRDSTETGMPR